MSLLTSIPAKNLGDPFSHTELNALLAFLNTRSDGALRAFAVNAVTTGNFLDHGFGTRLGLAANAFFIEVRAYDANRNQVIGLTVAPTTADRATLTLSAALGNSFTGTLILHAIPF